MELHELRVGRADMERLRSVLDEAFARGAEEKTYNARYRMSFVPYPEGYWFLHNCKDVVVGWLTDMGCSVSWVPIRLDLTVGDPP